MKAWMVGVSLFALILLLPNFVADQMGGGMMQKGNKK